MVVAFCLSGALGSPLHVVRGEAELGATRLLLAVRIHEKRTGQLPDDLSKLVQAGILRKLPVDPFSGKPFRYAKARASIWSVSDNEQDDGGVEGDLYGTPDRVWPLTATRKP